MRSMLRILLAVALEIAFPRVYAQSVDAHAAPTADAPSGNTRATVVAQYQPARKKTLRLGMRSAPQERSCPLPAAPAAAARPAVDRQAAKSLPGAPSASEAFANLAAEYWDAYNRIYPLNATFVNYTRYHDRLEDISAAGRAEQMKTWQEFQARLAGIGRSALDDAGQLSWDIMKLDLDRLVEWHRYKFYQWEVDHMDGAQSWIPEVVQIAQPMKTAGDAEALLARLKAMPKYFDDQIANLREGLQEGRTAVHTPVEKTIRQLQAEIKTAAADSPYATAAKRLPPDVQAEYLPRILKAVQDDVYPAYAAYLNFLRREYRPRARPDDQPGLSFLPGGQEAYRYQIRYHTTLDKTPEALHDVGLEELKDIHAQMRAIAEKMGHKGDLRSFMDRIRRDPKNFFTTREEIVKTAEEIVGRIRQKLPEYFGLLPKTPLDVKPIEEFKEKNDVAARYDQPPDDLSRPGVYYINTYEPKTRPRFSMTSLAAHEGVPGHHLQIAIALEQRGLPAFRRNIGFNAFVEGWALYSEVLAGEMGLYADDLSRVGMLSDQALRACRLVVDTGLHAMGWSRRRAIDFMMENTPMSEAEITAEVDRYISAWPWPGQALAYKVGQREILSLRKESQEKLGDKFDIRAFHDRVLKNGAVSLPILRRAALGPQ